MLNSNAVDMRSRNGEMAVMRYFLFRADTIEATTKIALDSSAGSGECCTSAAAALAHALRSESRS